MRRPRRRVRFFPLQQESDFVLKLRNQRDFWAGIFFVACGIFAIIVAQENELGPAARMGPAYFPTLLGGCLTALGAACALKGLLAGDPGDDGRIAPPNWKVLALVLGAISLFCLILEPLGLVISLAVMTAVCTAASPDSKKLETLVLIVALEAICWVIFVYLIGMTIPVLPAFMTK